MGIIFPSSENFFKKTKTKKQKQLLAVVCSSVIQRAEGEKLPVVFKEIRQDYKQVISSWFSYETWYFLIFPNTIFQEVRKEGDEKEEQKCVKSPLGNNLTGKMRKVMMI